MRAARVVVALVGVVAAWNGITLLLDLGWTNLRPILTWLAGGVLLHDAVLAPSVIMIAVLARRLRHDRPLPAPLVIAAVVLGTVSIVAVPVLTRFGARADNPTVLDRPYLLGWAAFVGLVIVAATLALMTRRSRQPVPPREDP